MTWREVSDLLGLDDGDRGDWHQHANGGGWVESDARVSQSAFISQYSQVRARAYIDAGVSVYGNVEVPGPIAICGRAQVYKRSAIQFGEVMDRCATIKAQKGDPAK